VRAVVLRALHASALARCLRTVSRSDIAVANVTRCPLYADESCHVSLRNAITRAIAGPSDLHGVLYVLRAGSVTRNRRSPLRRRRPVTAIA